MISRGLKVRLITEDADGQTVGDKDQFGHGHGSEEDDRWSGPPGGARRLASAPSVRARVAVIAKIARGLPPGEP